MSIEDEIVDRVGRGMLAPLRPRFPWVRVERTMLLSEALNTILFSPESEDAEWEERVGKLQADLEVFLSGERPIDPKYLFLLYPSRDAVWEIRSVRDDPSIRILGRFAMKDVFIATNHAKREDLGGWQSRAWKEVKRAAGAIWRQIFPVYQPLVSINIHDNVSGAHSGEYYRTFS
jgi:hypothetical protein